MKYLVGGLAFGVGVPLFLVGCLTLNPAIATAGGFLTVTGVQQFQ